MCVCVYIYVYTYTYLSIYLSIYIYISGYPGLTLNPHAPLKGAPCIYVIFYAHGTHAAFGWAPLQELMCCRGERAVLSGEILNPPPSVSPSPLAPCASSYNHVCIYDKARAVLYQLCHFFL